MLEMPAGVVRRPNGKETQMDRERAERHINSLYGPMHARFLGEVVEEMGLAALTDEAVKRLAEKQLRQANAE